MSRRSRHDWVLFNCRRPNRNLSIDRMADCYARRLRFEPLEDRRMLSASPIVVTTLADTTDFNDGVTSLREAIFAANTVPGADKIQFAPSLTAAGPAKILLTQGELAITDSLTITGPGADMLTIDASGNSQDTSVLVFRAQDLSTQFAATVSDLTLTGGNSARGGGICSYENLDVNDCVITGNSGHDGAAVNSFQGTLSLKSSTVTGNSSDKSVIGAFRGRLVLIDSTINGNYLTRDSGGGIVYAYASNVSIANTAISSNSSNQSYLSPNLPSAIAVLECDVTIDDSTVAANRSLGGFSMQNPTAQTIQITGSTFADNDGTGINVLNRGTTTITNCSISGNGNTGVVLDAAGSATLADSMVFNNRGKFGGISAGSSAGGSLLITDCKVFNNAGDMNPFVEFQGGGGAAIVVATGGQATVTDSSFFGNTKDGDGGGISFRVASGASGTITGCAIYDNNASLGGGIDAIGGVVVQQSTITGNTAYSGGGVYTYRQNDGPYLADCQISNNTALYGGGVLVAGPGPGTTTISRCDISFNVANEAAQPDFIDRTGQGGGIYAATAFASVKKLIVTGSSIAHNQAARHGGGIFGGAPQIIDSTISDNSAQIGGGLMMQGAVSDCTISGNSAVEGAGIYSEGIAISRSTIAANKATGSGDGILLAAGTLTLSDSILQNPAPSGPDIALLAGSTIDAHYNLIHSNAQSGLAASLPGAPDNNGNFIGGAVANAINSLIGPLLYNGGHALFDGVHLLTHALLPGSPAIDSGDPAAVAGIGTTPQFDERGAPFARVFGGRIDIGAVESQPNPLPGDYNFNGVVDAADYIVWRATLDATSDLRADGDNSGLVNSLDYAIWKINFGATLPTTLSAVTQSNVQSAAVNATAISLQTPSASHLLSSSSPAQQRAISNEQSPISRQSISGLSVAAGNAEFSRSVPASNSARDSALLNWLATQAGADRRFSAAGAALRENTKGSETTTDVDSLDCALDRALDRAFDALAVKL